jgi:hypothetical protein
MSIFSALNELPEFLWNSFALKIYFRKKTKPIYRIGPSPRLDPTRPRPASQARQAHLSPAACCAWRRRLGRQARPSWPRARPYKGRRTPARRPSRALNPPLPYSAAAPGAEPSLRRRSWPAKSGRCRRPPPEVSPPSCSSRSPLPVPCLNRAPSCLERRRPWPPGPPPPPSCCAYAACPEEGDEVMTVLYISPWRIL